MNKLKQYRLNHGLNQPQVAERLQAAEPRIDIGMVSRYENGVCLPTPPQVKVLEELYEANRFEIWTIKDLDLISSDEILIAAVTKKPKERRRKSSKKTFRMTPEQAKWFTIENLQAAGYANAQTWFEVCLMRFMAEFAEKEKK